MAKKPEDLTEREQALCDLIERIFNQVDWILGGSDTIARARKKYRQILNR